MIFSLGGVPGSGKTFLRRHQPRLMRERWLDIATVYADAAAAGSQISSEEALEELSKRVQEQLADKPDEDLVLEAFFQPGGPQRARIEEVAQGAGVPVCYIWCAAPREVCRQRVAAAAAGLSDADDSSPQRRRSRLALIAEAEEECFQPRPEEECQRVLDGWVPIGICRVCGMAREFVPCVWCDGPNTVCQDCTEPPACVGSDEDLMVELTLHERAVSCPECQQPSEEEEEDVGGGGGLPSEFDRE